MSEFEDRLNSILSSPEQMGKIMEIAKSLNGNTSNIPDKEQVSEKRQADQFGADNLDPKMLGLINRVMEEYGSGDKAKQELIRSLKPFLSPAKKDQLDRAYKLTRIAHVAKTVLSSMEGGGLIV